MLAAVTTTPDRQVKRRHVKHDLKFHYFLKDTSKRIEWVKQVSRGLHNFVVSDHETVCSNHFVDGKSSFMHPTPTPCLVVSDISKSSTRRVNFHHEDLCYPQPLRKLWTNPKKKK